MAFSNHTCFAAVVLAALLAPASGAYFVLVHGATQSAWVWFRIAPLLEAGGNTVVAVQLPGSGTDTTPLSNLTSLAILAAPILEAVNNATEPVVLVGHSLGGVYISTVAEALPEKIAKLVYLAAFLLPNNQSALGILSSGNYSTIGSEGFYPIPSENGGPPVLLGIRQDALVPGFFNRCTPDIQFLGVSLYRPQLLVALTTPITVTPGRWGSVKRFFIFSDDDNTLSPKLQRVMVEDQGVDASFFVKGSDHEVMLSTPLKLVEVLTHITKLP